MTHGFLINSPVSFVEQLFAMSKGVLLSGNLQPSLAENLSLLISGIITSSLLVKLELM